MRTLRAPHHGVAPVAIDAQRVPGTSAWLAREVASTTPPTSGPEVETRPRLERRDGEGFGLASFYGWDGRDGR